MADFYEPYISEKDAKVGVESGVLIEGPIRINPKNHTQCFVPHPNGIYDVLIDGFQDRNRALNMDLVVIQLLPTDDWRIITECLDISVSISSSADDSKQSSLKVSQFLRDNPHFKNKLVDPDGILIERFVQPVGKVVSISEYVHHRVACGYFSKQSEKSSQKVMVFRPIDNRVPHIRIRSEQIPLDCSSSIFETSIFVVKITEWPINSKFPIGEFISCIGESASLVAQNLSVLLSHDVDVSDFDPAIEKDLGQTEIPIDELVSSHRRDFTKSSVFTIDPRTARDLDDALSCTRLDNGDFHVGVHIADVSYFVKSDRPLDRVAKGRATSVYLTDRVVPMLPRRLCETLCSLNPGVKRLTVSAVFTIRRNADGRFQTVDQWFGRSVIQSCAKLSYEDAQSMLDAADGDLDDLCRLESVGHLDASTAREVRNSIRTLWEMAQQLRRRRFDQGALRVDKIKLEFALHPESGQPMACSVYQHLDSHRLVEEFMLLANMAVAHKIYAAFPKLAVLRRHEVPQQRMLEQLLEFVESFGFTLDTSSSAALHAFLQQFQGDSALFSAFCLYISRPMKLAEYFCAGAIDDAELYRHYALNVPLYTHFTSPIRRYPDIMVHRLLIAALDSESDVKIEEDSVDTLRKVCTVCNVKKLNAKRAQEASSELYFAHFVRRCHEALGRVPGIVTGILDRSFDVLLIRFGIVKRVYCEQLDLTGFAHVPGKPARILLHWRERSTQTIEFFSRVDCVLSPVDDPQDRSRVAWSVSIVPPESVLVRIETTEFDGRDVDL